MSAGGAGNVKPSVCAKDDLTPSNSEVFKKNTFFPVCQISFMNFV